MPCGWLCITCREARTTRRRGNAAAAAAGGPEARAKQGPAMLVIPDNGVAGDGGLWRGGGRRTGDGDGGSGGRETGDGDGGGGGGRGTGTSPPGPVIVCSVDQYPTSL